MPPQLHEYVQAGYINRNLVEMNHTASVSRQPVDIKLDPLYDRLHRPVFQQRSIDTGCNEGVVFISK
jgi:hypothetical protein